MYILFPFFYPQKFHLNMKNYLIFESNWTGPSEQILDVLEKQAYFFAVFSFSGHSEYFIFFREKQNSICYNCQAQFKLEISSEIELR